MEKKLRITEDERDKVFEEFQTAEEKLLAAEETATKVRALSCTDSANFSLLSLPPVLSCPVLSTVPRVSVCLRASASVSVALAPACAHTPLLLLLLPA